MSNRTDRRVSSASRAAVAVLGVLSAACLHRDTVVAPAGWVVLLKTPGSAFTAIAAAPNGALFAAGPAGVYRAESGNDTAWQLVPGSPASAINLCAPSEDVLFAISRTAVALYRFDRAGGWSLQKTPLSDSLVGSLDNVHHLRLFAMWCPRPQDTYAVGEGGAILHWNGREWLLEKNPLLESVPGSDLRSTLFGISGNSERAYAVGRTDLLSREAGAWTLLAGAPQPDAVRNCGFSAPAPIDDSGVMIGGGAMTPCLVRWVNGNWQVSTPELGGFQSGIFDGRLQADGSVLFWGSRGDVAEVRGNSVRVYALPRFRLFAGAAVVGDALYSAGLLGEDGVVARVTRD